MSGRVRERGTSTSPRLPGPDRERVRVGLLTVAGFAIFAGILVVIGGIILGLTHLGGPDCRDSACFPGGFSGPVTSVTPSLRTPPSSSTGSS